MSPSFVEGPEHAREHGRRPAFDAMPFWLKLVAAIAAMLIATWSVMIYLAYAERRDGSVAQAHEFAESVNQMTQATLTAMMILRVEKGRAVYLDQVRNSTEIRDLRVYRAAPVIALFGPGESMESKPSAEELAVMKSGKPHFDPDESEGTLRAIFPILNSKNALGKDCIGCHEGNEGDVLGAVSMKVSLQKAQSELRTFTWWISLLALGLSLPLLGAIHFFVRRFVARPLGGEPAAATDLANRIAEGDLEVEIAVRHGDTRSLMAAMSRMQHGLAGIVGRIHRAAESITVGAGQIATGNVDLSRRTDGQAASLEQTASSMEQITVTVKRNAENAKQADELAAGASAVAVRGREAVAHVVATMTSINASSRKIEDIISVIEGIAFQTNILALNAAVEAARAGREGRGFAVVAGEVRMLAQRSSAAAKDIKRLIADSVEKVVDGTKQVDEAGKTMDEIVSAVKRVNLIMAEIAAASQEQSLGIGQVNQAVREMEVMTQQNAALVQEATAAAESLQAQSNDLVNAASEFRLARVDGGPRRKYGGEDGPRDVLLLPAAAGVPAAI